MLYQLSYTPVLIADASNDTLRVSNDTLRVSNDTLRVSNGKLRVCNDKPWLSNAVQTVGWWECRPASYRTAGK